VHHRRSQSARLNYFASRCEPPCGGCSRTMPAAFAPHRVPLRRIDVTSHSVHTSEYDFSRELP
jgi:hypothetical protein